MERGQPGKWKAAVAVLVMACGMTGCAVWVERPTSASQVVAGGAPARVGISTWTAFASLNSFRAWVAPLQGDGTAKVPGAWREVTNDFTAVAPPSQSFPGVLIGSETGTIVLPLGAHRFRAEACWYSQFGYNPRTCGSAEADVQAVQPQLTLGPASLALEAGNTATVTVTAAPPPGADLTVTLSSPLTSSATLTIPADTATAVTSPLVTATRAGSSSLTASAGLPFGTASVPVTVRPRLSTLTPTSGVTGTTVNVTGAGFVAPMTVLFGATSVVTPPTSLTQAQVAVPAGLAAGSTVLVTVQSGGQIGSVQLPFAVQAVPAAGTLLFRSHASGVETIRFTPASGSVPASFSLVAPASVGATSPGLAVVGLIRSGSTLIRASASAIETFTIGGTVAAPTLSAGARSPATGPGSASLSGNGADAAFLTGQLLRGTDRGLEVYQPGGSPLAQLGALMNRPAATSAGISLLAYAPGARLLRSTSNSLELWDLTNPAAPSVQHNNTAVFTAPLGSGLVWVTPGQRLVRGFSSGIQVLDLLGSMSVVIGANNTGGSGSLQAVAALPSNRIARSTGQNLEVYDLTFGPSPVRCATSNAGYASPTGVALAVDGSMLFRATATGIEAWDLSALVCSSAPLTGSLPAPVQFNTGLAAATTGLGLAGPN